MQNKAEGRKSYIIRDKTEGRKFDAGKLRYDLLPPDAIRQVVEVIGLGAAKYCENNWKYVVPFEKRYIAAAMRHFEAYRSGEEVDPETGKQHLAHAICCMIFLLEGGVTSPSVT